MSFYSLVDYDLLAIAENMPDHATPPARMSGGDRPVWDADMSWWLDDMVVHQGDKPWERSVSWDRTKLTVLSNPRFVSPHFWLQDDERVGMSGFSVSGTIGG